MDLLFCFCCLIIQCSWSCPPPHGAETTRIERSQTDKVEPCTEAYAYMPLSIVRLFSSCLMLYIPLPAASSFFNLSYESPEIFMSV